MKTYLGMESPITITAPSALTSGQPFLVGAMFGIAQAAAASGAKVSVLREGVVQIAKDGNAISQGAKTYWDNTNSRVTATAGGNTLIGYARDGALAGDATAAVVLTGVS